MKTALLLDENKKTLRHLESSIQKGCPDINIVGSCSDAYHGRDQIIQHQPDMVFLDTEMKQLNGFELLSSLPSVDFAVIFLSSSEHAASKVFEFDAVDYLLKPIQIKRLQEAVSRAKRVHAGESLLPYTNLPTVPIPTQFGYEFERVDQIMYAEADSNYSIIYFNDGRKVCVAQTLKRLESMFRYHPFIRIHQSYLVNLSHVKKYYKGGGGYVVMSNGKDLTVSRRSKDRMMQVIRFMQGSVLQAKVS